MNKSDLTKSAIESDKKDCKVLADERTTGGPAGVVQEGLKQIGDFCVHPAASVMPLMADDQFDDLVQSIEERGLGEPIEFKDDQLVEGRHRLRAILLLQNRGIDIEVQTTEWQPLAGETVADYVQRKNLHRRHLTDAQRLQCAAELLEMAKRERADAGHPSGRIQKGEIRNPGGSNQHTPTPTKQEGMQDSTPPSDRRARNKAKAERSTAGQLAKVTGQSLHKCRQAHTVQTKGTPEEIAAVKAGRKSQREVVKEIEKRKEKRPAAKKPTQIKHPFKPSSPLEHDLLVGWVRLREKKLAVPQYADARKVMRAILDAEERAVMKKKKPIRSASGKTATRAKTASPENGPGKGGAK